MLIRPAEYDLQRLMQLSNRAVAPHEQTTPDLGTDFAYPDAQLIDFDACICIFHPAPLLDPSSSTLYVSSRAFAQRSRTLCPAAFLHLSKSPAVSPRNGMVS